MYIVGICKLGNAFHVDKSLWLEKRAYTRNTQSNTSHVLLNEIGCLCIILIVTFILKIISLIFPSDIGYISGMQEIIRIYKY